jgi:hypothetical protein
MGSGWRLPRAQGRFRRGTARHRFLPARTFQTLERRLSAIFPLIRASSRRVIWPDFIWSKARTTKPSVSFAVEGTDPIRNPPRQSHFAFQVLKEAARRMRTAVGARRIREGPPGPLRASVGGSFCRRRARRKAAIAVLQKACESAGASPREDLDRRLFLALQSEGVLPTRQTDRRGWSRKRRRDGSPGAETGDESAWPNSRAGNAGQIRSSVHSRSAKRMGSLSRRLQEALASQLAAGFPARSNAEARRWLPNGAIRRRIGHLELDRGRKRCISFSPSRRVDWQMVPTGPGSTRKLVQAFETWQRARSCAARLELGAGCRAWGRG